MSSRRGFLQNVLAGAGIFASAKVLSAQEMQMPGDMPSMKIKAKKETAHDHYSSVLAETPDVPNLPFRMDGDVKEFHLIAKPLSHQITPTRTLYLCESTATPPRPTIQSP